MYFLTEKPLIAFHFIWQVKQNKKILNMVYLVRVTWFLPHLPVPLWVCPLLPSNNFNLLWVLRPSITLLSQDLAFAPISLKALPYLFYPHPSKTYSHF